MGKTQKRYYEQPPVEVFSARVLACEPQKKGWLVELDATAFYPEGGGQPADRGVLGGAHVLDVQENAGAVLHLVDAPLTPGDEVEGRIDMARRWDYTQQHSGEHILSGLLHEMFGAENVGFHIGEDYLTMDTSCPIPDEGLLEAERRANEVIWADVPIEAVWHTNEELRAITYRSKKELEGPVRIVTIPHADCCACCGTHVRSTGQVGQVKILEWHNYKQGVRLVVVCGARALRAFEERRVRCADIGSCLSAKFETLTDAVERQKAELEKARFRVVQLENELFCQTANSYSAAGPVILEQAGLEPDGLRRLAAAFGQVRSDICALFAPGEKGCAYVLADPAGTTDLRPLAKMLNQSFAGRGGGKPGFCQGSLEQFDLTAASGMIREFLNHENAL